MLNWQPTFEQQPRFSDFQSRDLRHGQTVTAFLFLEKTGDLIVRKFTIYSGLLGVVAQLLWTQNAFAQVTEIQEGPPTFETTPTQFGPVGTYVLVSVRNTPSDWPTAFEANQWYGRYKAFVGTDDKVALIPLHQFIDPYQTPTDVEIGCVYAVTQSDINRGQINFIGNEDGRYRKFPHNHYSNDHTKFIFDDSFGATINYDPNETGWQPYHPTHTTLNLCSASSGWNYTDGSGGFTESSPLRPDSDNAGIFLFNLGVVDVPSGNFWIDPPVAVGYTYSVTNAEFISVTAPSNQTVPDPDGYILEFGTQSIPLQPGQSHTFTNPVSSFDLKGINPDLSLDPTNEMAFPIGIDLTDPTGDVQISQTPHTENFGTSNTPPIANAGPDLSAHGYNAFNLDGSGSSDPDGDALTYHWSQLSGPNLPLTNAQTATPSTYPLNVTAPTTVVLELKVEDSHGAMSAPDQVELTMLPSPNLAQCTPWNRDKLVEAINFYPEGNGYSVTQDISGQIETDLQNWANNLSVEHPNFGRFEIKSYVKNVGTGPTPDLTGAINPATPPMSRNFTVPATTAPATYWTGGHFIANNWYRLDTKVNVWSDTNRGINAGYSDQCVYQTVYFKIDQQSGNLQTRRRVVNSNPVRVTPKLVLSDGTNSIGSTKTPKPPKSRNPIRGPLNQPKSPFKKARSIP